jgi:hypothetical protein
MSDTRVAFWLLTAGGLFAGIEPLRQVGVFVGGVGLGCALPRLIGLLTAKS